MLETSSWNFERWIEGETVEGWEPSYAKIDVFYHPNSLMT